MAIVLDASAALAWLAPSQETPASAAFRSIAATQALLAPAVFAWEVRHALLKLERRGLVPATAIEGDLSQIETTLAIESPPDRARLAAIVKLARAETLGVYDAAYLDLSIREGAALASRDGPLLDAARRQGLVVHDLR